MPVLRDFFPYLVNKMNNLNLDGVFVTGDITSSALKEEFVMARQILNGLKVPW